MQIYLANVGANLSKHRFAGPVFEDGRFEFLPIPADNPALDESPNAIRYRDLRSRYDPAQALTSYIPAATNGSGAQPSPAAKGRAWRSSRRTREPRAAS